MPPVPLPTSPTPLPPLSRHLCNFWVIGEYCAKKWLALATTIIDSVGRHHNHNNNKYNNNILHNG